jgi:hypothetical protein
MLVTGRVGPTDIGVTVPEFVLSAGQLVLGTSRLLLGWEHHVEVGVEVGQIDGSAAHTSRVVDEVTAPPAAPNANQGAAQAVAQAQWPTLIPSVIAASDMPYRVRVMVTTDSSFGTRGDTESIPLANLPSVLQHAGLLSGSCGASAASAGPSAFPSRLRSFACSVIYSSAGVCALQLVARSPTAIRSMLRLIRELAPEQTVLLPLCLPDKRRVPCGRENRSLEGGQQHQPVGRPAPCLCPALESAQQLSAAIRAELRWLFDVTRKLRAESAAQSSTRRFMREQLTLQARTDRLAARLLGGVTEASLMAALAV